MTLAARDALLTRLLGQEWPHEPLLEALAFPQNIAVLDVGAGEGRLLNFLIRTGHKGRLAGLDPQPGMGVQVGQAEALPFEDQSFGAVLMVRMLTHCQNPAQALAEACRVLRPGGRLVVAVQGRDHLAACWSLTRRLPPTHGPEDDTAELLHRVGFSPNRFDLHYPVTLSRSDVAGLIRSYGAEQLLEPPNPLSDQLHLAVFTGHN